MRPSSLASEDVIAFYTTGAHSNSCLPNIWYNSNAQSRLHKENVNLKLGSKSSQICKKWCIRENSVLDQASGLLPGLLWYRHGLFKNRIFYKRSTDNFFLTRGKE